MRENNPVPTQEGEWSCVCVLVVWILPLSEICIFYFGIVPMVWHFFFFSFLTYIFSYMLLHINENFLMWKIEISYLSFSLTSKHCQFSCVAQGVNQTELYLLWPSFQVQWDGYDQVGDGHEILYWFEYRFITG